MVSTAKVGSAAAPAPRELPVFKKETAAQTSTPTATPASTARPAVAETPPAPVNDSFVKSPGEEPAQGKPNGDTSANGSSAKSGNAVIDAAHELLDRLESRVNEIKASTDSIKRPSAAELSSPSASDTTRIQGLTAIDQLVDVHHDLAGVRREAQFAKGTGPDPRTAGLTDRSLLDEVAELHAHTGGSPQTQEVLDRWGALVGRVDAMVADVTQQTWHINDSLAVQKMDPSTYHATNSKIDQIENTVAAAASDLRQVLTPAEGETPGQTSARLRTLRGVERLLSDAEAAVDPLIYREASPPISHNAAITLAEKRLSNPAHYTDEPVVPGTSSPEPIEGSNPNERARGLSLYISRLRYSAVDTSKKITVRGIPSEMPGAVTLPGNEQEVVVLDVLARDANTEVESLIERGIDPSDITIEAGGTKIAGGLSREIENTENTLRSFSYRERLGDVSGHFQNLAQEVRAGVGINAAAAGVIGVAGYLGGSSLENSARAAGDALIPLPETRAEAAKGNGGGALRAFSGEAAAYIGGGMVGAGLATSTLAAMAVTPVGAAVLAGALVIGGALIGGYFFGKAASNAVSTVASWFD